MDNDQRLECIRIAATLTKDPDAIVPLAAKLYEFVRDCRT